MTRQDDSVALRERLRAAKFDVEVGADGLWRIAGTKADVMALSGVAKAALSPQGSEPAGVVTGWYLRTGHGDSIHFGPEPPQCLMRDAWRPFYASPAPAQQAWQPIETAPKDGRVIHAWVVHENAKHSAAPILEGWEGPCLAQWTDFNGGGWTHRGLAGQVTHWLDTRFPINTTAQGDSDA